MTQANLAARLETLSSLVAERLRRAVPLGPPPFAPLGAMQGYHLGWYGADLQPLAQPLEAGKRLRSALCLLVCEALAGRIDPALSVATGIELVHNFSLIHDDIQDESETRRHRPTVWKLWGTAQAINVGDAMYTAAYLAMLDDSPLQCEQRVEAIRVLGEACLRLVEGQYLDLELQHGPLPDFAQYEAMVGRKTAALLAASAELGALCAGAEPPTRARYHELGRCLGLAFQFQDDVLGVWGDERVTGKSAAADIRSGKKSLPVVLALQRATPAQTEALRRLYALPTRNERAAAEVLHLFDQLGVRAEAERLVERQYRAALDALEAAPGRAEVKHLLAELITSLRARAA